MRQPKLYLLTSRQPSTGKSILALRTVDPSIPCDTNRLMTQQGLRGFSCQKDLNHPNIITVSMRAYIQLLFSHRNKRHRISGYSLPNNHGYCHVTDAVIQEDTTIVGSDGPC